ncbi:MAG: hypothetical protein WDA53_05980 [Bacillota bacterium]
MRVRKRLRYLMPIYLLLLLFLATFVLSACDTQSPAPPSPVITEGERPSYDLDGFPPMIPHEIDDRAQCLACHRDGEVGKAPKTPHPEHNYCRQCHALEQ